MRTLCSRTEIVDSCRSGTDTWETCAAVVATHNENTGELTLSLDSFVRVVNPNGADREYRPAWLPEPTEERHPADVEDAWSETRIVFREWTEKVSSSIPSQEVFLQSLSDALVSVPVSREPLVYRSAFRREV